jgi:phosphate starvation-inducible PhoH-like protein
VPTETLHFENARLAQQVFNSEPRNLAALEAQLGVKATARDSWIKLDGDAEALGRARHLFQALESSLKDGGSVRNHDFLLALEVARNEGGAALQSLQAETIRTSTRKAAITPRTLGQRKYVLAIRQHDITLGIGPAGTGKTYLAMAMATAALRDNKVGRLILTRPAVEAGEALGFLPGDLQEKLAPYLRPLYDALHDMLPAEEIQRHLERGTIEIAPLAYMRGRTLSTPSSFSMRRKTPRPSRCSCSSRGWATVPGR